MLNARRAIARAAAKGVAVSTPHQLAVTAVRANGGEPARITTTAFTTVCYAGRRPRAPGGWWPCAVPKAVSIDPMHPQRPQMIAKFFQRFEDRNPGESGRGLNFFFSDELGFGVSGWLWNSRFADEFHKRKGYDIVPELPALFVDIGPRTPKVRLDYSDVMVALEEENYFRPVFEWHRSRGMMYGCDHGGRGRDVTEFGDYFRTQRWMSGPGNDQPGLSSDVIKNKVASSIAHLYQRPRTWLEGYYGSGWGTSTAEVVDATWRNFVMGHNLLTLHGLYYSTHGGWWEWAPPCNHFRMPYWQHMGEFLRASERLSYLLSQGHHRATSPSSTRWRRWRPAWTARSRCTRPSISPGTSTIGYRLRLHGFRIAGPRQAAGRELRVSGERYRALVIPAMRAVRHSTLEKALEFHRSGGRCWRWAPCRRPATAWGAATPRSTPWSAKSSQPHGTCNAALKSKRGSTRLSLAISCAIRRPPAHTYCIAR